MDNTKDEQIIETLDRQRKGELEMVYARRDANGYVYCTFKPVADATKAKASQ